MKIIIDISEDDYRKVQDGRASVSMMRKAIINGIPLSEGHGDLIDVSRKITVSVYDDQYEEWGEKTLTILEALNKWSDEGVTVKDVVVPADEESEDEE